MKFDYEFRDLPKGEELLGNSNIFIINNKEEEEKKVFISGTSFFTKMEKTPLYSKLKTTFTRTISLNINIIH